MKKFLCMMLCIALAASCVPALAEITYSLPEKWQRQVDFGNGVKGTAALNVSGEAEWAKLLAPLNGKPIEIRAIQADERFQYRIYAEDGENMVGLTQLYGDGEAVYLKSDLLPDMLLTLATGGDVLDSLTNQEGKNNPALYSAMGNILGVPQTSWEGKWQPALSAYETAVEMWMEGYASAPSVKRDEAGNATVLVRYDIPAQAVKEQIKALWRNVLQDPVLLPLLKAQMTEKQQAAYLDPNWQYYYDQVIDGLPLDGSVVMEREMTPKGEAIRMDMTLPLSMGGFTELRVDQDGTATTFTLQGESCQVMLDVDHVTSLDHGGSWVGKWHVIYADAARENLALAFTYTMAKSASVDEDTRAHEITDHTLRLEKDGAFEGTAKTFEPMEMTARVHLHSKGMQYNPVSLDVAATFKQGNGSAEVTLDMITRSPWVLDDLPTEGAKDAAAMPREELAQMLVDLGMNGLTKMMMVGQQAAIPLPEITAVPEDTAEPAGKTAT